MSDLSVSLAAPNGTTYSQPTGLFIANEFRPSKSSSSLHSINPTNEAEICSVHAAGATDIDDAVAAARAALKDPAWRSIDPTARGQLLYRLADLVEAKTHLLATIETWDNGKPFVVAQNEDLPEVILTLRYYAGWTDKLHGQTIPLGSDKLAYTMREPVGVCGQIIPWNYPLAMAAWKLGPALACGNTVVMKPAEQTPLSILVFAELIREAGFPPGVVNIVNGEGRVAGAAIAAHLGVDKVAFTGSTSTGREIMKAASSNLKSISLECGGKSPLLVFDDADLDQAVKWSHAGIMANNGQICTATSRILVQSSIYARFVEAFKEQTRVTSIVGDPFAETTFQGPQVTKAQYDRILSYIETGKSEGATLAAGGLPQKDETNKGYFIAPTIFTDVTSDMRIYNEEVFGPFVTISSFDTEEEAIARANETMYGLGSSVFTENIQRGHRVARGLEAGMVWINSSQDSDPRVPFGGVKMSGVGRELGERGLDAYSNVKSVHVNVGTSL